jgi:hypothetical protein
MDLSQGIPFKLDAGYLLINMLWSTIGAGFWIYGKKQRTAPPLFGGAALVGICFVITSAFWLSVASIGIIVGIYYWSRVSD